MSLQQQSSGSPTLPTPPLANGPGKAKPHTCTACGATFSQRIHLETHTKNVHAQEKPFVCQDCSYRCSNKGLLDKHVSIVHNRVRNFSCPLCTATFGQKVHLDVHTKAIHMQEKPFACDHCAYKATTKGLLDKHVRTVHLKERPFGCQICGSRFGQKAHLQKHVKTHQPKDGSGSGTAGPMAGMQMPEVEKAVRCGECSYACANQGALTRHYNKKHQKSYQCAFCPATVFYAKSLYDQHLENYHSIARPHRCVLCHDSFTSENNLKVHLKQFHSAKI